MNPSVKWYLKLMIKPKEIKLGLVSSSTLDTVQEITSILSKTNLKLATIREITMGFVITGESALEKR